MRHFTRLSQWNYSVDNGLYPLGSCTMKYNPRINEEVAPRRLRRSSIPLQPEEQVQGALELMWQLEQALLAVTRDGARDAAAGGRRAGRADRHADDPRRSRRGAEHRGKVLIPDTAHGTNPASARVRRLRDRRGRVDAARHAGPRRGRAAPRRRRRRRAHGHQPQHARRLRARDRQGRRDAAREGRAPLHGRRQPERASSASRSPGEMGVDVMHINLHKTFSTPHGGGGPGAGPVAVSPALEPFLPVPIVEQEGRRATRSTTTARSRSAGCARSTATSACWCAPHVHPRARRRRAQGDGRRRRAQRQLRPHAARGRLPPAVRRPEPARGRVRRHDPGRRRA